MKKWILLSLGVGLLAGLSAIMWSGPATVGAEPSPAAKKAEPPPVPLKTAASRIIGVTVYPNSALVTREVDVPEGAGNIELVVTPLPPHTVDSSLYSEGTDGIRVLTTRYRMRPIKEDVREEVRKAEDELKKLQLASQKIEADVKAVELNIALVGKMENFTATTTQHSAEKGALNSESAIALSKYVMESRGDKAKELVTHQQQLQANQEQVQFVQRQLRELTAGSSKTERDAVIVVDKRNPAAGKVRLNYLVDQASWRPQYKLRAGKDEKDPVQLEYLGAVVQQTGEDWNNVDLVLSTAQPMLNAAPPELRMLEVAVLHRGGGMQGGGAAPGNMPVQPPGAVPAPDVAGQSIEAFDKQRIELRSRAQKDFNEKKEGTGNTLYNQAAALEQARELVAFEPRSKSGKPSATDREGPSVTYHLNTRLTVPSRNDEQVLEVARIELPPEYFYKAVPVLTSHVYRLANLTNKSKYVLLPGEATMYLDKDFVGRMNLPLVAIGEHFTAGFGVDPQLQVHRQVVDKSRTTQGGNQVLKYEYRILVSSYKAEPVTLQVWDRLPHAETETAGVNLVKATPELCKDAMYLREDRPNNLLRWDVKVEPAMSGEKALAINYEFKLELDRQMSIGTIWSK